MSGFQDMMKKAQAMQAQMAGAQDRIKDLNVEGQSGGGLVRLTLSGKSGVQDVHVDASLLSPDEKEVLEDLIAAAVNDARKKMEQKSQEEMAKAMEGLQLPPGIKIPGL